jgi:hypothetical protein
MPTEAKSRRAAGFYRKRQKTTVKSEPVLHDEDVGYFYHEGWQSQEEAASSGTSKTHDTTDDDPTSSDEEEEEDEDVNESEEDTGSDHHTVVPEEQDDEEDIDVVDDIIDDIRRNLQNTWSLEGFSIIDVISKLLSTENAIRRPNDFDAKLWSLSDLSKGVFSEKLKLISNQYQWSKEEELQVLSLVYHSIGKRAQPNLPWKPKSRTVNVTAGLLLAMSENEDDVHEDVDEEEITAAASDRVDCLNLYTNPLATILRFDVCPGFDFIYVGENINLKVCPKCGRSRFKPCTIHPCKGGDDDQANEDEQPMRRRCRHGLQRRVANLTINYRPIIPLILQLLRKPRFVQILTQWINLDTEQDVYTDLLDGEVAQEHLSAMDLIYQREKLLYKGTNEFIHIPLLMGLMYDGGKTAKHQYRVFWPLFVSILNLPPSFRYKINYGMFLLGIFSNKKNSTCEEFLFSNCLIPELQELDNGIEIEIEDKTYFIQGRLILHMLDTPGLAEYIRCKGSGDGPCPLCRTIVGKHEIKLFNTLYRGHRVFTPINHISRSRGQSKICCPEDYYTNKCEPEFKDEDVHDVQSFQQWSVAVNMNLNERKNHFLKTVCGPQENKERVKEFLLSGKNLDHLWFHEYYEEDMLTEFNMKDMTSSGMYFEHCDYREQILFDCVSNNQYLMDGMAAIESGVNDVNGVKNIWPFGPLPYVKIGDNISFDQFHSIAGILLRILILLFPEESRMKLKVRVFCLIRKMHCHLYDLKKLQNHVIRKRNQRRKAVQRKRVGKEQNDDRNNNDDDSDEDSNDDKLTRKRRRKAMNRKPVGKKQNEDRNDDDDDDHYDNDNDNDDLDVGSGEDAQNGKQNGDDMNGDPGCYKTKPLFELSGVTAKKIDAWVNAIFVPTGFKNEFQVSHIFARSGQLRGVAKIDILRLLMDFITYCIVEPSFPNEYKLWLKMFSYDINLLLSDRIPKANIDKIFHYLLESIILWESRLPPNETTIIVHELIHGPHFVTKMGPVRGWWAFASERGVGYMTKKVPQGGASFDYTAFKRYLRLEQYHMEHAYGGDNEEEYLKTMEKKHSLHLLEVNQEQIYHFTKKYDFALSWPQNKLFQNNKQWQMTNYEIDEFFLAAIQSILRQAPSFSYAIYHSPLFRLYYFYVHSFTNPQSQHQQRFRRMKYLSECIMFKATTNNEAYALYHKYILNHSNITAKVTDYSSQEYSMTFVRFLRAYCYILTYPQNGLFQVSLTGNIVVSDRTKLVSSNDHQLFIHRVPPTQMCHASYLHDSNIYKALVVSGRILKMDQRFLISLMSSNDGLKLSIFRQGRVNGVRFSAREFSSREDVRPQVLSIYGGDRRYYSSNNPSNDLRSSWNSKRNLSSWCKIKNFVNPGIKSEGSDEGILIEDLSYKWLTNNCVETASSSSSSSSTTTSLSITIPFRIMTALLLVIKNGICLYKSINTRKETIIFLVE